MRRKTTKHRRQTRQSVLEVRVMSPRIAWFGFLKFTGKIVKIACVLAVLTGIGWGVWRGIQRAFYKNPDFRLQVIDLNANPVIDELGVTEVAGIDLTANPSLFDVNVDEASRKLSGLPALTEARVERHLPGTLVVRVVARSPKAWISCVDEGLTEVRRAGGMLVDSQGVAYPCPDLQTELAADLPVIDLPASAGHPIQAGTKVIQPELEHCFALLDSARAADSKAPHWIESIRQVNDWSLLLVTRQGTSATFGLGDHARQIDSLRAALDHAGEKGYVIATINLIPKYNIPITVRGGGTPPRAIPVPEAAPVDASESRRARDLSSLLNRN
jgi:hypothetical protein